MDTAGFGSGPQHGRGLEKKTQYVRERPLLTEISRS